MMHPLAVLILAAPVLGQTTLFHSNFESGIPSEVQPGTARIEGVQGYGSLAPGQAGRPTFAGMMLRSATTNRVVLRLTGLPPHNALNVEFLFAAIDSLDGTGAFPSGDFFRVDLDGKQIFRESFANAIATQVQSYASPPGGTLARRQDLGFSQGVYWYDSAYDMGIDLHFANLPHTGSTAVFEFVLEGPGVQSLGDESWGFDELRVTAAMVANLATSTPFGVGCGSSPLELLSTRPVEGTTLTATLRNIPAGAGIGFLIVSGTRYPMGIPAPLGPCSLYVGLDDALFLAPTSSALQVGFAIPPGLFTGTHFYLQAATLSSPTPAGIVTSNGLDLLVNPN